MSEGRLSTVVKVPSWIGWIGYLELDWRNPGTATIINAVTEEWRLVRFDQRGNGVSDLTVEEISFQRFVDDLESVFDAAGVKRAPIISLSRCAIAAAFGARRPERVSVIVMIGGFPQGRDKRQSKREIDNAKAVRAMMAAGWDDPSHRCGSCWPTPLSQQRARRSLASRGYASDHPA